MKHLIGYLDKVIRALVLIMPEMSGYVKVFKVIDGDKDKNNKFMSFRIDHENLSENYKAIWAKIKDLSNIELNALPVYDDRYVKIKIRAFGDKVFTYLCGLNMAEDDIQCESFTLISTDSSLVYQNKYYLQACLYILFLIL